MKWHSGKKHRKREGSSIMRGTCICPKCGTIVPHAAGVPCRDTKCPVCHVTLVRNDNLKKTSGSSESGVTLRDNNLPKVNIELCTGCGNCKEVCPADAISVTDGIAVIDHIACSGCRLCESSCPSDAIY